MSGEAFIKREAAQCPYLSHELTYFSEDTLAELVFELTSNYTKIFVSSESRPPQTFYNIIKYPIIFQVF